MSSTAEHFSLPQAKLGYLNETFKSDEACSCNVKGDSVKPSSDRCQSQTSGTPNNTSAPGCIPSEETYHTTESRAAEGERRENNRQAGKLKTVIDVDFEKYDKAFSDKSVDDCGPDSEEAEAPEGGWGYIVVLGAFILSFINGLVSMCFGILFIDFLLEARASLTTTTALITTQASVISVAWLMAGPLIECLGWRTVVLCGAILIFSGLVIAAFTPSVELLFFSYSLLTGLGNGFATMVAVAIPSFYFKRKRGKACAFVLSGSNVATVVGPVLVSHMKLQYGFRGAVLITAAITLHGCVSATVFHPVEWQTAGWGKTKAREQFKPGNKKTMVNTFTCYWRLMKYTRTFVIVVAYSAASGILRTGISLIPLVLEKNGHTEDEAAFITSVLGVCGFVGRMLIPSLADTSWFNIRVAYIACILAAIVSLIAFSMTESVLMITIAMAVFGFGMGGVYGLGPLMMVFYMGLKNFVPLLALSGITTAVLLPTINPLYGVFETLSGGYSGPILFLSCQAGLAMVLWLLMPIAEAFDKRRITPLNIQSNIPAVG